MNIQSWRLWLCMVLVSTVLLGSNLAFSQHLIRQSVSDELVQKVDTSLAQLQGGQSPAEAVPPYAVDLRNSSAPFAIITGGDMRVLASSAQLDRVTPLPPQGVFDQASRQGSNEITWAPERSLRLAIAIKPFDEGGRQGFVLHGMSLKPSEERAGKLLRLAGLSWLAILLITTLLTIAPLPRLLKLPARTTKKARRKKRR